MSVPNTSGKAVSYRTHYLPNGYLVVSPWTHQLLNHYPHIKTVAANYQGIDQVQWPIEMDETGYRRFLTELGSPPALTGLQVATIWDKTYEYWGRCLVQGLPAQLLLVSTRYTHPVVAPPQLGWKRLGYDVADPLGVHSVLKEEVIRPLGPLHYWNSRLNSVGLFDTLETAEEFINDRLRASRCDVSGIYSHPNMTFVPVLLDSFARQAE